LIDDARWEQLLSRDPALNGSFLTGFVRSGVYCLPSCKARTPRRENVRLFRTPEEAKRAGMRACGRCCPDAMYPGSGEKAALFAQVVSQVLADPGAFPDTATIGRAAGVTWTSLNELFRDYAQESPAAFLKRVRVRHASGLLRQGTSPADAALGSGSLDHSVFTELFTTRTGLTPEEYSGLHCAQSFSLRLPEGYRSQTVLDFYARDGEEVSEKVTADSVNKCILDGDRAAKLELRFENSLANCTAAHCKTDAHTGFTAHAAAVRMLGLDCDATGFERQFSADPLLGKLIAKQHGLRIPLTPTPWEALAWAIIGQQINLPFAINLRRSLILAAGSPHPQGLRAHPSAQTVAAMDLDALRALKFSGSKAKYLLEAARQVASGELDLAGLRDLPADQAARTLGAVKGVGPWTVQYVFLRGIGFPDCLPAGDAGLAQGLARLTGERPTEQGIRDLMAPYTPWRSLATYHVWTSLKSSGA
jgi:AraC family transcriptional regulator of adaptative response / DNA-3-methyladenine glycosylase II